MAILPESRGGLISILLYLGGRVGVSGISALVGLADIATGRIDQQLDAGETVVLGMVNGVTLLATYVVDVLLLILFLLRSGRFPLALLFGTILGFALTFAPPLVEQTLLGASSVPESSPWLFCGLAAYCLVVRSEWAKTVFVH